MTALIKALEKGHKDIVEALLNKGANVNAREPLSAKTALTIATEIGQKDIVELLTEWGATE
ncbi:MAG: Ankyrin repeats (3 copies) [Candidatus Scalindua rubra]|uniref:Ankyrin repeats (3 copies) n=1 Tax=Candidatus Scalindua rubra TaxID=1872076 RepID=A0A1E3X9J3_9BACT|nr:MAG: Ankyrin repeats (3 copies) [Candidatus Scalindua rubra]